MKRHLLLATLTISILLPVLPARAGIGTEIYDTRGKLITVVRGKERRLYVRLADIPQVTRDAVLAIEDARFYAHNGVDLQGIARALWTDLRHGGKVAGGSTITQQLVKNKYLSSEKTFQRKLDEARLALEMERKYSKDQILEMYLNEVYWGHGAYGIEAAAQTYFGHSARTLNLQESALLAALLKAPEHYSPYRDKKDGLARQRVVLDRMAEVGFITEAQAERAKNAKLKMPGAPGNGYKASYFTSYLVGELIERYGADVVLRGDLKIQTTLDLATQEAAERLVSQLVAKNGKRFRFDQAALVAINPHTGGILAMVGGADFRKSEYNRAVLAHRQPGSTFKPFVYLTAFAQGIPDTLTMADTPVTYPGVNGKPWTPGNYHDAKEGTMTLRRALELSNNVITIKLLDRVGPQATIETARKLGLKSPMQPTLSLGLGSYEVTPLELASAYGVLAANGVRNEPIAYWNVRDASGRYLETHRPSPQRVFDEAPIRLITDVLQGVVTRGTGTTANAGRPVAGKTGTTNDSRDAWFVGYTPQMVVALWVGNDDNSKMARNSTGGVVAAPTWGQFVRAALKNVPVAQFAPPALRQAPSATGSEASRSLPNAAPTAAPVDAIDEPSAAATGAGTGL
ncbi:MAG TPA: PBP1A family penicillin-binding protein [Pantanalinema sp.]